MLTWNALLGMSPRPRESAFRPPDGRGRRFLFRGLGKMIPTVLSVATSVKDKGGKGARAILRLGSIFSGTRLWS